MVVLYGDHATSVGCEERRHAGRSGSIAALWLSLWSSVKSAVFAAGVQRAHDRVGAEIRAEAREARGAERIRKAR